MNLDDDDDRDPSISPWSIVGVATFLAIVISWITVVVYKYVTR